MKKPLIIGLIVSQILLTAVVVALAYNQLQPRDDPTQIREMVVNGIENLKKPAPVEAKTGDTYFPGYGVYLPQTDELEHSLTYEIYEDVLSIGTDPLMNLDHLYNAHTSTELFDRLPKIQACERGIRISRAELPNDDADIKLVLAHEVEQASDQTLYVYYEEACPDVKFLADILAGIKEY